MQCAYDRGNKNIELVALEHTYIAYFYTGDVCIRV